MDYLGIYLILIWGGLPWYLLNTYLGGSPRYYYPKCKNTYYILLFMVDYLGVTIQSVRIPIIYYLILFRVNYLGGVDVPWTCQWINAVAMAETFINEFIWRKCVCIIRYEAEFVDNVECLSIEREASGHLRGVTTDEEGWSRCSSEWLTAIPPESWPKD